MFAWLLIIMAANELFILVNGADMFRQWAKATGEFMVSNAPLTWGEYKKRGIDPFYVGVLTLHGWMWLLAIVVSACMFLFLSPHKILPLFLLLSLLVFNHLRDKDTEVFVTDTRFWVDHSIAILIFLVIAI